MALKKQYLWPVLEIIAIVAAPQSSVKKLMPDILPIFMTAVSTSTPPTYLAPLHLLSSVAPSVLALTQQLSFTVIFLPLMMRCICLALYESAAGQMRPSQSLAQRS